MNGSSQCAGCGRGGFCCCYFYWLFCVLSLPPAHRTGLVPRGRLPLESGHSVGYIGVRDRHVVPTRIVDMGQSVCVFGGEALRANQEPDLRCLLAIANIYRSLVPTRLRWRRCLPAIANLYRTLVGSEPTYVGVGRRCDCETAP